MNIMLPSAPVLDLGDTIIGWFEEIVNAFIDMFVAIPRAFADIFSGWSYDITNHGWYGPILAAIVIIAVFLIFYGAIWLQDSFFE